MSEILEVLVNGHPIKTFAHQNKVFVEGRKGQEFSLRVKNNHASRKLFNVSIDGINVIDGKTDGSNQGYVLAGYSSYEVKGFRTSNSEVVTFKFDEKSKSYANNSADFSTKNVGVIGLRVFNEIEKPLPITYIINQHINQEPPKEDFFPQPQWWYPPYTPSWTCRSNINSSLNGQSESITLGASNHIGQNLGQPICCNYMSVAAPEPQPSFSLGTAWGQTKTDVVSDTFFDTGSLLETVEIYYGTENDLIKMGVDIRKKTCISFPQAFPDKKFCQPPKYGN